MKRLATLFILVTTSGAAWADGWSSSVSGGLVVTSGNTQTQSLNGRFDLAYQSPQWEHAFYATGLQSSDQESTTAERYTAGYKVDYNFTEFDYVFFSVAAEKDLYGSVRERLVETVGYGRRLLNSEAHKLDVEIGAGGRQQQFQKPDGESEQDAVGRLAGEYLWTISPTSKFKQNLLAESGETNTYLESVSELKLSIIGNLFASLSFTARHNTEVSGDTVRTDTITAVNLSYDFGKSQS